MNRTGQKRRLEKLEEVVADQAEEDAGWTTRFFMMMGYSFLDALRVTCMPPPWTIDGLPDEEIDRISEEAEKTAVEKYEAYMKKYGREPEPLEFD